VQLIGPEGPRIGSHCVYLSCVAPLTLLALGLIDWVFSNLGLVTVPYGSTTQLLHWRQDQSLSHVQ